MEEENKLPEPKHKGLPICIAVENRSDEPSGVALFDIQMLFKYNIPKANETKSYLDLDIECETPGLSYNEILRWLSGHQLKIRSAVFYFDEWIVDFNKQVVVVSKYINGTRNHQEYNLETVPFENGMERTFEINDTEFYIDSLTAIWFTVPANRKLHIELYEK